MDKKVSIIIPAYNVAKYVDEALQSCMQQTYKNIEIIVVNDGSTDNLLEVLQKYDKYPEAIKVITIKNQGLSVARNIGMEHATGKYIMFLDGDDWLEYTLVKQCVNNMEEELEVFFYNAMECTDYEGKIIDRKEQQKYNIAECVCDGSTIFQNGMNHPIKHEAWRGCYSKKFLDENGIRFIPKVFYEDNSFWLDIMISAKRIKYSNFYGYNYRVRKGSIINSSVTYEKIDSVLFLSKYMLEKIQKCPLKDSHLIVCANKIVDLIRGCESRVPTKSLKHLKIYKEEVIQKKEELIEIICSLYNNNSALLKSKYYVCSHLCFFVGIYKTDMLNKIEVLREEVIFTLRAKMSIWPLQNNVNVGVFGSGRNADVILCTYRKIFGRISANYVYIDSEKESLVDKHLNREIINVQDIKEFNINKVIICSVYYENEMYDTLVKMGESIDIYRVYDEDVVNLEGLLMCNFFEIYKKIVASCGGKRLFLIGTPEYPNIGDHLIALAEHEYLNKYFPEYVIIEISSSDYIMHKTKLKGLIRDDDLLMVTGGGFLGSLWTEGHYDEVIDLVEGYPNNQIVILPQSIFFHNNAVGEEYIERTRKMYLGHKSLKICLREKYSYDRMVNIVGETNRIALFPDIALYYQRDWTNIQETKNVGVFLRCDRESVLTNEQKIYIRTAVSQIGPVKEFSMHYHSQVFEENRIDAVIEKINEIRSYKFVVTDALHCMIICALTGVPCIAINNISLKVEGVYRWIEGNKNVILYESGSKTFKECIEEVLANGDNKSDLGFLNVYWEELEKFIRGNNE